LSTASDVIARGQTIIPPFTKRMLYSKVFRGEIIRGVISFPADL